jgi:3'(2'), 5'-bisphosphate nucleotidase
MSGSDAALAAALAREAGVLLMDLRGAMAGAVGDPKALGVQGDLRSNDFILGRLSVERPDDAVLSEESADDPARLEADRVWIVDPLDGTREFGMDGRTDWAVHVALWQRGLEIAAAAVSLPALGAVHRTDDAPVAPAAPDASTVARPRIVVSDSRPPLFIEPLAKKVDGEIVRMGSAGAKAMAVLRGDVDAYVHAGGQWEWDSAAPVGVALAHGLHASRIDGSPLRYNQSHPYLPDLLICRSELAAPLLAAIAEIADAAE